MKIHYFSSEPWEEEYVRAKITKELPSKQFNVKDIVFHSGSVAENKEVTDPEADVLCTFIESPIGEAEFKRFPTLKLLATRSTGYDHIDMKAAAARGITVTNVPSYGENTVAEFAFALLLALSRRVEEAHQRVVETSTFSPTGLRGFDLAGKTIGVVGTGHIGAHMIRIAQGFGMNILAFDAFPDKNLSRILNFTYVPLVDLLASSDIVSIHVPYNKSTHHLINRKNIGDFKKGAYLINTARGAVVETQALIEGLTSGHITGAGLDVLEEEGELADESSFLTAPHPNEAALKIALENHYLITHPRVIVTPHLAFNTKEAVERILDTTIDNIREFAEGTPVNVVEKK